MDLFHLKLELINFSKYSPFRWRLRRIFIGFLLFIYYTYALIFFFTVAFPDNVFVSTFIGTPIEGPGQETLEFESKEVTAHPLILMFTFGFLGGVFFITRTFVRTAEELVGEEKERKDVAVAWYLTRPMQSALMAIFIYYAFRAGQLVFYSGTGSVNEDELNVYTLSLIAIVAGAFSEQAFEKLHSIATGIFKVKIK